MKNKKRTITLSVLILTMVIALTYVVTNIGAWLTDQKDTGTITVTVGKVEYDLTQTSIFVAGPVVPGENIVLGNDLKIQNKSSVKSQIRFTYELTITPNTDPAKELLVNFDSAWVRDDNTPYYYLNGKDSIILDTDVTVYNVLNSITMDGAVFGNAFKDATISLIITFQAKQADHLTWEQAGSLNFTTGLNN